jgi:hypothetical protein
VICQNKTVSDVIGRTVVGIKSNSRKKKIVKILTIIASEQKNKRLLRRLKRAVFCLSFKRAVQHGDIGRGGLFIWPCV